MTKQLSSITGKPSLVSLEGNPLADIINHIPWEMRLLDLEFADEIREIVTKHQPGSFYTNKYILLLVAHLVDAGYLEKMEPSIEGLTLGRVIFIKRV